MYRVATVLCGEACDCITGENKTKAGIHSDARLCFITHSEGKRGDYPTLSSRTSPVAPSMTTVAVSF